MNTYPGQASVALSFPQPEETLERVSVGTRNLLEAIRFLGRPIRFCTAGSGECFGDIRDWPGATTWSGPRPCGAGRPCAGPDQSRQGGGPVWLVGPVQNGGGRKPDAGRRTRSARHAVIDPAGYFPFRA